MISINLHTVKRWAAEALDMKVASHHWSQQMKRILQRTLPPLLAYWTLNPVKRRHSHEALLNNWGRHSSLMSTYESLDVTCPALYRLVTAWQIVSWLSALTICETCAADMQAKPSFVRTVLKQRWKLRLTKKWKRLMWIDEWMFSLPSRMLNQTRRHTGLRQTSIYWLGCLTNIYSNGTFIRSRELPRIEHLVTISRRMNGEVWESFMQNSSVTFLFVPLAAFLLLRLLRGGATGWV